MYITIYPSGLCKGHIEYPSEKVGVIFKDGNVVENFGLIYILNGLTQQLKIMNNLKIFVQFINV